MNNADCCVDKTLTAGLTVGSSGAPDFTCSPFDTPATASDGVILS